MNKEIWKDKKDYEGHYQVSNCGRVKSIKFGKERILKPKKDKYGYLHVNLYKNSKRKDFLVHRLVAEAFLDNPNNLPLVNHKDENPSNNFSTNLEWCTHEYNINYGTSQQRKSLKLSKPVGQYSLDNKLIKTYPSINECGRNGYNYGHVAECCRGERKSHKGYIWKFL